MDDLAQRIANRAISKRGQYKWEHAQNSNHAKDCFYFVVGVMREEGVKSLPNATGYSRFSTMAGIRDYCDANAVEVIPKEHLQDADVVVMQYSISVHVGIINWNSKFNCWYITHLSMVSGTVDHVAFDKSLQHRWVATYRLKELAGGK